MTDLMLIGQRAKAASRSLAIMRTPEKNAALNAMADEILRSAEDILTQNQLDVESALLTRSP